MLAGDDRVLVEPYNYGKVASPMEGASAPITLGTDMSLMEFGDRPDLLYADDYDALRFPYSLQIDHYEYVFSQAQPIELFQSGRENAATV